MVMMMTMTARAGRLCQVLEVRHLAVLRRVAEIRRQLAKLVCLGDVAAGARCLGRALQILRDLPGDLLIFGRVGLLHLLERAQHLRER